MALLESLDIPLGSPIEHFQLIDPFGKMYSTKEIFGSKGLLIVFTCNHCPYAIAVWPRLIALAVEAKIMGIETIAINPNINPTYPEDAPEKMKKKMEEWKIPFPYLVDEKQTVARTFRAQCTPDIYLFGNKNTLVYHGRIDDNWQMNRKCSNRTCGRPLSISRRANPLRKNNTLQWDVRSSGAVSGGKTLLDQFLIHNGWYTKRK